MFKFEKKLPKPLNQLVNLHVSKPQKVILIYQFFILIRVLGYLPDPQTYKTGNG